MWKTQVDRFRRSSPALLCAAIATAGLQAGCTGGNDGGGAGQGVLTGTVTNSLTRAALGGAMVSVDPLDEDLEIATGSNGGFSQVLPAGTYTLTFTAEHFNSQTMTVSIFEGLTTEVDARLVPTSPVVVTTEMQGAAQPGATVQVKAVVETLDGSNVQGYTWTPAGSPGVVLANGTSDTVSVTLQDLQAYKAELFRALAEPPIGPEHLPPNVPLPEGEFPGGLRDRFYVVGLNPFTLEETARSTLTIEVRTSSGTYTSTSEIHAELPWQTTTGLRNVPIGVPVLLHGKGHLDEDGDGVNDVTGAGVGTYDWSLQRPAGSTAALADGASQNPYFTPDVPGLYTVTVTNTTEAPGDEVVTLEIHAGTWEGAITGQDASGRPLAADCTTCHNDAIAPDTFTPWAQTGHAEIFKDNINTGTHYSQECFSCHMVGFQPQAVNGGADDAPDYDDFIAAGLLNNPGDNWTTILAEFPQLARMTNVQCENCHGPQNGGAHTQGAFRIDLSSDTCASCHGEPLRHGRYQQWQLSAHANYELANEEGNDGSCSRCHTVNGFLAWLPILLDDDPATDPLASVEVTWTPDDVHPQTCVTCHDPHNVGSTTGAATNATVRISGDTPPLIGGFTAVGVGRGAICMTCHNTRRGLHNDSVFESIVGTSEASRAPHGSAQGDVLMGQNAFLVEVGVRGSHSLVSDTCVNCHMVQTPPPDLLSYEQGGTNHTFYASRQVCAKCHGESLDPAALEAEFDVDLAELRDLVEDAIVDLMAAQIAAGNRIDLDGEAVITMVAEIDELVFGEASGRQGITITLAGGTVIGPMGLNSVHVVDGAGISLGELYDFADERLIKAGWNWNLVNNDGSKGVHNVAFVFEILDASTDALRSLSN